MEELLKKLKLIKAAPKWQEVAKAAKAGAEKVTKSEAEPAEKN